MAKDSQKSSDHTTDFLTYDVGRATFYDDPAIDAVVTTLVAMGSEVWSAQRRIKVLETVLAKKGISLDEVDSYKPSEKEEAAWRTQRDEFIRRVYGALEKTGGKHAKYGAGMDSLRQEG
ncbi:MAG: hypothetical protein ABJP70_00375 [Erythrobacter sp.]